MDRKKRLTNVHWAVLLGLSLSGAALAQTWNYELIHAFGKVGQPQGGLIQATDGYFYGTTSAGGTRGVGTVFKMDSVGNVTTLHSFNGADGASPWAALVEAGDGSFYGTTSVGGAGVGTVFKIDPSGNFTTLHSFSSGSDGEYPYAALIQTSNGDFYGTTSGSIQSGSGNCGTVFRMDTSGKVVTLHTFGPEGCQPRAALIQATDGDFYGTTQYAGNGYGTVFKMNSLGNVTTLHSFDGNDGLFPSAALIQASDGNFYGTTSDSVFKMSSSGDVTVLHSLSWTDGWNLSALIQAIDGKFYGTAREGGSSTDCFGSQAGACGTIFKVDSSGNFALLHTFNKADGASPGAALIQTGDEHFYGTTAGGGGGGSGTIFQMDSSGNLVTLRSFQDSAGANPQTALLQALDGQFYGTTFDWAGPGASGAAFKMDSSGTVKSLHIFDNLGNSSLIQTSDGSFYGTTQYDGVVSAGTVFQLEPSGGFTTVHSFDGNDGLFPSAALIQASDGNFYGTTSHGGDGCFEDDFGCGTVFKMDPSGSLTTLHSFSGRDGWDPEAALIQAADGSFYGTTRRGGTSLSGSIFKVDASGTVTTLHSFDGSDGAYTQAALTQASDGNFYGTTAGGGADGAGTLFKMDSSGNVMTLHSFSGPDGVGPVAALMQSTDGKLYGMTGGMGRDSQCYIHASCGTIFTIDSSGNFTLLHTFNLTDGALPAAALIRATDGDLYGTASWGGPAGEGVIFRLTTSTFSVNAIQPRSGPASIGTAIDVLGGGFAAGATLTIGGTTATNVSVPDPTFVYGTTPVLSPGTLSDVTVTNPGSSPDASSATILNGYFADFLDVPQSDIFHDYVERIFRAGITAGCGNGYYCRDAAALRKQMAVFVLKAKEGASYTPPPATGIFTDVPASNLFAPWIEELYNRGVVAGCGAGPTYCPDDPVLRQQIAVFLLKTLLGSGYVPPACAGIFPDVPCSSPFALWIEDLVTRKIAAGCGDGNYCPTNPTTRGQMAVFLVKTFNLP